MEGDNNTAQSGAPGDSTMIKPSQDNIRHSHLGPILGVLLLALVLVAVGLFLWGDMLMKNDAVEKSARYIENNEPETPRAEADKDIFDTLSPSTELDAIEADVKSTNLDSIDSDLNTIDRELDSALGPE